MLFLCIIICCVFMWKVLNSSKFGWKTTFKFIFISKCFYVECTSCDPFNTDTRSCLNRVKNVQQDSAFSARVLLSLQNNNKSNNGFQSLHSFIRACSVFICHSTFNYLTIWKLFAKWQKLSISLRNDQAMVFHSMISTFV